MGPTARMDRPTTPISADSMPAPAADRRYDGILCFGGEDWWYHNRGHYDMRIMQAMSRQLPVLYVNSLGMRVPRPAEGRMFARRISRKLRSLGRGLHRVDDRFAVLTAPAVPGRAMNAVRPLTLRAIRRAMAEMGITRPLAWVACPTAEELLRDIPHEGLVYQRTDRFEAFLDVDVAAITAMDRRLKDAADLVVYCSGAFMDDDAEGLEQAVLVDHGVDAERFIAADAAATPPADVANIPGPRVGFVGAIDPHTFDPELFNDVVHRLPEANFVLVGGCTLPEGWCTAGNVHLLGQRTPDEVADYMAACDVLIMPWRRSDWIDACHPVKLKEYLAVGRPIVTTPFRELSRYPGLVARAEDAAGFAAMIARALEIRYDEIPGRERVAGQDWANRAAEIRTHLRTRGLDTPAMPGDDGPRARRIRNLVAGRAVLVVPGGLEGFTPAMLEAKPSRGITSAIMPEEIVDVIGGPVAADDGRVAVTTASDQDAPILEVDIETDSGTAAVDSAPDSASDDAAPTIELTTDGPVRLVLHPAVPARAQELPEGDLPIAFAVILAGGLRPSPLQRVLDRSAVDWWVTPEASVLQVWTDRLRTATAGMSGRLPIRVVGSGGVPAPWPTTEPGVSIERDPHAFRGPAGVVLDLARALPGDRHVIVVEGARHLDASMSPMIADHLSSGAAVTVGRNPDGSPAGIYCIRRSALDLVPVAGFCDLKEQWLPRFREAGGLVLVHDVGGHGCLPLHTRTQLIHAARIARQSTPPGGPIRAGIVPGPQALRVVCRGAMVGPEANILDSIVMPGAYVGAGTTVIRSIIGPETVVPPDTLVVDGVLHAGRILDEGPRASCAA